MAKIAIISDLHANYPALTAVLSDIGHYDHIICAGDMVGYYAEPNQICQTIRHLNRCSVVRGNHDGYITGALNPDKKNIEAYRVEWTKSELNKANMNWLKNLRSEEHIDIDGWSFYIRHANPWDEQTYIYPDSDTLINQIELSEKSILILGHTHYPMLKHCGKGLLINPGSVGQPRDRNPKPSYVIFDTKTGKLDFRRVLYDVATYQNYLTEKGWPEKVVQILSRT